MSDFLDQVYDEMNLQEVICRLPGELAVKAIKRRIGSADKLVDFFDAAAVEKETSKCDAVKQHINDIVRKYDDIGHVLDTIGDHYHPVLHGYLDTENKNRFLTEGANKLSIKFHFNLIDKEDLEGMKNVLHRVLCEPYVEIPQVLAILNKVKPKHFQPLATTVLKHTQPSVRASILSVFNEYNYETISDHQKMIALKAFAKIPSTEEGPRSIQPVDFHLFRDMKPMERLFALDKYLSYFPVHQKRKAFDPEPTEEDFDAILFAGCFQYYDLVESIKNRYRAITEEEA